MNREFIKFVTFLKFAITIKYMFYIKNHTKVYKLGFFSFFNSTPKKYYWIDSVNNFILFIFTLKEIINFTVINSHNYKILNSNQDKIFNIINRYFLLELRLKNNLILLYFNNINFMWFIKWASQKENKYMMIL